MRNASTIREFFPQLRTDIPTVRANAASPEALIESGNREISYQFLVHPQKNSIYAGEQIQPQAPELQLPLLLHSADAAQLINLLDAQHVLDNPVSVKMEARLQALDGLNWIFCDLQAYSLPGAYKDLLGWHVQAYLQKPTAQQNGARVLAIISQLFHAGLWQYNQQTEIIELDGALQKVLNLPGRTYSTQEWLSFIHPEDVKRLYKKLFNAQQKKSMFHVNIRFRSAPTQAYRYLTLSAGAFAEECGSITVTGLCFDGTHAQRLKTKNLLNKAFLEEAQSLGNIGCFEWLPEHNTLEVTRQLKLMLGITSEEDISMKMLQQAISADDFAALVASYKRILAGDPIQELNIRYRKPNGTVHILWIRAKGHLTKTGILVVIGIVQDITYQIDKQVQLQAKDRLIGGFIRNLPVCIMAVNRKLQIISVIGNGLRQAGIDRKQLLGKHLPSALPAFENHVIEVFRGTPQNFVTEHQVNQTSVSLFNYYYFDEEQDMAVGFSLDISNQKQAEHIAAHLQQLEHRYQLMDTFVHAVAHDLRSPVVNLDMLLSFLTEENAVGDNAKYISAMTSGVQHLKRTLDALIEILRIEKDSTINAEEISFSALLHELENEYQEKLTLAQGKINTYLQCESIRYNRAYLSSILRNLISNAIKYSYPDRPPRINICAERKGDLVVLLVQDNGMGMDLDKWGHLLFKPFKRLNNHRNGTGIGLHLVKQIIEKNGGKIKVKSKPGTGTSFFCFLRPYQ